MNFISMNNSGGQGFGSEILEKVKSFLKSQGAAAIVHLELDENNPKAVRSL